MVGRFFLSLLLLAPLLFTLPVRAEESRCGSPQEWAELARVVDGDTLILAGGERLRVIGINTPELASRRGPAEAFSGSAKAAVQAFFAGSRRIGLRRGRQTKDRHGRSLVHIYRADGLSLAQQLLAQGLAMHIVVPPNSRDWQCLAAVEAVARAAGRGQWGSAVPLAAAQLTPGQAGFAWVRGRVDSISRGGDSYWLAVGNLAVRIADNDLGYFDGADIGRWQGRRLLLRGWIVDRSRSAVVQSRHFKPLLIPLRHPAMVQLLTADATP